EASASDRSTEADAGEGSTPARTRSRRTPAAARRAPAVRGDATVEAKEAPDRPERTSPTRDEASAADGQGEETPSGGSEAPTTSASRRRRRRRGRGGGGSGTRPAAAAGPDGERATDARAVAGTD